MGSPLGSGDTALAVDLNGGDVPVSEQLLNLADIDPGPEEQGGRRGSERAGRIRAGAYLTAVTILGPGIARQAFRGPMMRR
jgi:hypothetical protein